MTRILLKINGTSVASSVSGKITSGSVGLPVIIEYDDSWSGLSKTAFFRFGGQTRKQVGVGTSTAVPWEILRNHGKFLEIGIEGRDESGSVTIPTIWATVGTVYEGASGEIPAAPTPDSDGEAPSSGAVIDDSQISEKTTWSSKKISDEILAGGGGELPSIDKIVQSVIDALPVYNGEVEGV